MDFLSAMFKGIGDTFTAGAKVDSTKLENERAAKERELAYATLYEQTKLGKLNFVLGDAASEQKIIVTVITAVVVLIGLIIVMRFRK
ncbi:MAG TPA: hypothetical protein VL098_12695 [Flavipsychrobacter sp.]|nr:hypothetical protein [Flavipsychrobacter sp.]